MKNDTKVKTRKANIVIQELDKETLVYDLNSHKAYCLNQSSTMIWNLCDGNHSISEISKEMSENVQDLVSEEFVILAINQFHQNGFLESNQEINTYFSKDFSRRDVIKRVGLSTIVALPIVSSIVAPQAAMAQSASAIGQACTFGTPATCITGNCMNTGGNGTCCSSISTQANGPGYHICTTTSDENIFAQRCCSGVASINPIQMCPEGQTRYICEDY